MIAAFLLFLTLSLEASEKVESPMFSTISALIHRSTLREYASKIENGNLTAHELKDYIRKGGNIHKFERYDVLRDFSVGKRDVPLIDYFIHPFQEESLGLLLSAGVDPDQSVGFAVKANQLEALKRLVRAGGTVSSDHIPLVKELSVLEFLLSQGAKIPADILSKIDPGISPEIMKAFPRQTPQAIKDFEEKVRFFSERIVEWKKQEPDSPSVLDEEKRVQRMQENLKILRGH